MRVGETRKQRTAHEKRATARPAIPKDPAHQKLRARSRPFQPGADYELVRPGVLLQTHPKQLLQDKTLSESALYHFRHRDPRTPRTGDAVTSRYQSVFWWNDAQRGPVYLHPTHPQLSFIYRQHDRARRLEILPSGVPYIADKALGSPPRSASSQPVMNGISDQLQARLEGIQQQWATALCPIDNRTTFPLATGRKNEPGPNSRPSKSLPVIKSLKAALKGLSGIVAALQPDALKGRLSITELAGMSHKRLKTARRRKKRPRSPPPPPAEAPKKRKVDPPSPAGAEYTPSGSIQSKWVLGYLRVLRSSGAWSEVVPPGALRDALAGLELEGLGPEETAAKVAAFERRVSGLPLVTLLDRFSYFLGKQYLETFVRAQGVGI